jgi:hypothetical protein
MIGRFPEVDISLISLEGLKLFDQSWLKYCYSTQH